MKGAHGTGVINPAFPLVYGGAFVWTLGDSLNRYWCSALPDYILKSLPMVNDQKTASTILAIFAAVSSAYIFILYIRLEFFEHDPPLCGVQDRSVIWRVVEFLLRAAVVLLTTLKLMHWSDFSSLLEFYLFLSVPLCLWVVVARFAENSPSKLDMLGYAILPFSMAFVLYIERGKNGTLLMIFTLMIPIIITGLLLILEFGKIRQELAEASRRFFRRFFYDAAKGGKPS